MLFRSMSTTLLLFAFLPVFVQCVPFDHAAILDSAHDQSAEQQPFNGTIWALLVAGSNEYYNYRHQADVCHAYHVLRDHGIPEERIITMMYDDIADNEENPTPGVVINRPGGPNVYQGVVKDYTGEDVTPAMFLKVLQGDETLAKAGKKVVTSGPHDHVFVYFADHGAPGLIAFPSGILKARDLSSALKRMYHEKKYGKLVLYIEACESGSMFEGLLPSNLNIFASTAANGEESSYACYYDDVRETYLGDVYSVNWLQDSDARASLSRETIASQFKLVKKETNTSHVQEFGDLTIGRLHVAEFQGLKRRSLNETTCDCATVDPWVDAVPSHDVPLMIQLKKAEKASNESERQQLMVKYDEMVAGREAMMDSMELLARRFDEQLDEVDFDDLWSRKSPLTRHECYERLVETYQEHCFNFTTHPYSLRYLYLLVNVCEAVSEDAMLSIEKGNSEWTTNSLEISSENVIDKYDQLIIEHCQESDDHTASYDRIH
ncbi:Legumain [Halotydeus destructor]|nr:Legumain [Halotydeus destructor]